MDKTYIYKGPVSSVTLPGKREVTLSPGRPVTLPADNRYVGVLLAKGFLKEVPAAQAAPQPAPVKADPAPAPAKEASSGN
jgi:hypothetical protein